MERKEMTPMGFRNMDLVDGLLQNGACNIAYGKGTTLDPMQVVVLYKLARVTADYPLDEKAKEYNMLPRVYSYGWLALARELGMTLPDSADEITVIEGEPRALKKELKAVQRISMTVKKLKEAGLIKCLRKGSASRRNNAVWLLTIGDPEENAEVERYVRAHMYL